MSELEYNWIVPGMLAQGSFPGSDPETIWRKFDTLVYMAEEGQPDILVMPGKTVFRAPIDDNFKRPVSETEERRINRIITNVETHVRSGRRVLVTCMAGRNRSGLLVALVLMRLYPCKSAREIIEMVRDRRKGANGPVLCNPMFVQKIMQERLKQPSC